MSRLLWSLVLCLIPQLTVAQEASLATVEEAAKLLDLRTVPMHSKAAGTIIKSVATQMYELPATENAKEVFGFIQKELAGRGWKDTANPPFLSPKSCSATFTRNGYSLAVTVFEASGKDGKVIKVVMTNQGNLDVNKLYVPKTGKKLIGAQSSMVYAVESSIEDARKEVRDALIKDQWEPYGMAGSTHTFRKNAIKLDVGIYAGSRDKKTNVSYMTRLLPFELPAPTEARLVTVSDSPAQLFAVTKGNSQEIASWFEKKLTAMGWKSQGAPKANGIMLTQQFEKSTGEKLTAEYAYLKNKEETNASLKLK